jgi:hypothetical protein
MMLHRQLLRLLLSPVKRLIAKIIPRRMRVLETSAGASTRDFRVPECGQVKNKSSPVEG